jgi:hypothetical protein
MYDDFQEQPIVKGNFTLGLHDIFKICLYVSRFYFCISLTSYVMLILIAIVLSSIGVTYKTGFGFGDWIYCTLYIHTVWVYRQLQLCR